MNGGLVPAVMAAAMMIAISSAHAEPGTAQADVAEPAGATESRQPGAVGTVGELDRIQSRTLLLQAKSAMATAQAAFSSASGGLMGAEGGENAPLPSVAGVYGANGKRMAELVYPDGRSVDASVGMALPGGVTVTHVDAHQVLVSRAGKRIPLGMSGAPLQTPSAPTAPAAVGGMPGFGH